MRQVVILYKSVYKKSKMIYKTVKSRFYDSFVIHKGIIVDQCIGRLWKCIPLIITAKNGITDRFGAMEGKIKTIIIKFP